MAAFKVLQKCRVNYQRVTTLLPATGRSSSSSSLSSHCLKHGWIKRNVQQQSRFYAATGSQPPGNLWSTEKVMLLTSLVASLGYVIGGMTMSWANSKFEPGASKPKYANQQDMENGSTTTALQEVRKLLGEDRVTTDGEDLRQHGLSEWSSHNADRLPVAVAYPKSTEEVSEIAKICNRYHVPISAFSGGTSLEANFSAPFGGLSVDFAYMDEILAVHADDMDVVVQPAVPWMELNEKLKSEGLFFPVDPAPTAHIGGMVSTACSGTNAVRYGPMKDWVVNLTVVLADGRVIKTRRRPRKTAAGYNLTNLFVGSEGTLGLVTEITLRLAVVPQETSVAVVTFPRSLRDAASAATKVLRSGVPIAAMEIMDDVQMKVVNAAGSTARKWDEVSTLFFKFSGTAAGVEDNIMLVKKIAKECHCGSFEFASSEEEKEQLWSARKNSLWSTIEIGGANKAFWGTDVAVPVSQLPDLIESTKEDIEKLGVLATALGHIGDGNFHTSIVYDKQDPVERAKVEKCIHDMVYKALELEGTCSGEHGIGIGKKDYLLKELGVETVEVMKAIKKALDPNLIMNPGKVIDF